MGFDEFEWDAHSMAQGGPTLTETVESVALWWEMETANEVSELCG